MHAGERNAQHGAELQGILKQVAMMAMQSKKSLVREFEDESRARDKPKRLLWRRPKPADETGTEYFHLFDGSYRTTHGHSLYWFVSSEKRLRDRHSRKERLRQAEAALAELVPKLNARCLKRKPDIQRAAGEVLEKYHSERPLNIHIQHHVERWSARKRGRPGKQGRDQHHCRVSHSLHWSRNADALRAEAGRLPFVHESIDVQTCIFAAESDGAPACGVVGLPDLLACLR